MTTGKDYVTELLPADEKGIERAALLLKQEQAVALPTETVYGLAASALSSAAVQHIFAAKGRPADNPLIAHICNMQMLPIVAQDVPPEAFVLAEAFWPGPLTLVLPRTNRVAPEVSAGLSTVGVRMPAHPVAQKVIEKVGVPLAAPSANLSGSPSPTMAAHVMQDLNGRIPLVLDGGASVIGLESTVLSLVEKPVILRPGGITKEQIEAVLGQAVHVDDAVIHPLVQGRQVASPGMKYRHYAPKAEVTLVEGTLDAFCAYTAARRQPGVWALCFEGEGQQILLPTVEYGGTGDNAAQAAALYAALRRLDEKGAKVVYARAPLHTGVGLAVYNRLLRAAAFRVVEV